MDSDIVLRVYYNDEIIPDTKEGVSFVSKSTSSYVIPCFTSFSELQNSICRNIDGHISKVIPLIELYVEFEEASAYVGGYDSDTGRHREIKWYEDNSDSEDDFETNCGINGENENVRGEEEANTARQIAMDAIAS
ncbi:hypothetical protein PIB30_046028 [Stylosanthes scabra]|uniref:Uncharacterized protein n=1 Tax=Stylosanthes scabra TaxID=79078 RepID=A0ABU6YEM5_9FABA|nr:hypothetical protein [Stylosanthes scabra]